MSSLVIHDTRGYIDAGPSCSQCGACECPEVAYENQDGICHHPACFDTCGECGELTESYGYDIPQECIGLSYCLIDLDGGDAYCTGCVDDSELDEVRDV